MPDAVVIVGNQNQLPVPGTLPTAAPVRFTVPEISMKDAMPCEISPLDYHLSTAVKEKIWKGEFIDILLLLPFHKDFAVKSARRGKKSEEGRRRTIPRSFHSWLQAYCVYCGVTAEKHREIRGDYFST